ncbi:HpcH/HpaI aldolase/citrate lyase family protein [soil metagenome]
MRNRQLLADPSKPVIGTFVSGGVTSLEVLAWSGFDTVCIETEHATRGIMEVAELIRAADGCDVPSIVRVQDLSEVGRVLDAGADGIIIPHIDDAEQARAAVRSLHYPPTGDRGSGPGRVARHGLGRSADLPSPLLILMVESETAVANISEIAAVPGVDVLFVGPYDLSTSMGVVPDSDSHTSAITAVLDACRLAGRRSGIFCRDTSSLERWLASGATFFLLGSDHQFLAKGAREALEQSRAAIAQSA